MEIIDLYTLSYGVSFWLFTASVAIFIGVIVYEQMSIRSINKQSLILELIEGEKKIRNKDIEKAIEMTS